MVSIDKKDEKILIELILNSRIPVNRLAKKVGISREVANYRLQNLKKQKIISEFYTIINTEMLGFSKAGCFFQLKGISKQKEKEFLDYLIKHKFVSYAGPIIGKWSLIFDVLFKDKKHLSSIIKEIKAKFSKYIDTFIVVSNDVRQETFPIKIFGIKKEIDYPHEDRKVKLNSLDLQILKLLSVNSRIGYQELSKKLKLTANAIKHRIVNLEKTGIIQGYTISLDIKKLGYDWYNIQIKQTNDKREEELSRFLRENKKAIYFYNYLGNENWDIDIGLIIRNSDELRDFIIELREKFGDMIKIHDLYVIVEESKGNYSPEGVFDIYVGTK